MDGTRLACGSGSAALGKINFWNVEAESRLLQVQAHTFSVDGLSWSPQESMIVSSSSFDCEIFLWDAESGLLLQTFEGHTKGVTNVLFAPDGRMLASGSGDETVIMWDVDTGEKMHTLEGHRGGVRGMAWSHNGMLLAAGTLLGVVIVWNTETGEQVLTFEEGHNGAVLSLAFRPDDKTLVSASNDGTVVARRIER